MSSDFLNPTILVPSKQVLIDNIEEFAPIIYTPTIGLVCQRYSGLFRRPRGMYFTAKDRGEMMSMIYNWPAEQVTILLAHRLLYLYPQVLLHLSTSSFPNVDVGAFSHPLPYLYPHVGMKFFDYTLSWKKTW